ncbi:twin-arginine translocase subunit TatC [Brevibacillus sp. NRS-1366]|uniref:twin-arginine translocase subunit TatC n=1 Tax=Brevibacillus sp. NRS-1366 TaxID=3233899 RepID=UPI003D1C7615
MRDNDQMTVVKHLSELRKRIVWVLAVFVMTFLAGLYFAGPIIEYLKLVPMEEGVPIISLHPSDALRIYMQFSMLVGAVATLPVALYHTWRFVSVGLNDHERRMTLFFIPIAFFLFVGGVLFGYYIVFSMMMKFLTGMSTQMGVTPHYGIAAYFDFMFQLVIPIGVLFELPIVVMFLTRLRILNPMVLVKMRRFAYFGLTVVTFILTPPELVTEILVTIPLLLLYELSIWLSRAVYRKQLKEDEKWKTNHAV